jgi:peptide/nickel transport system ATP-binding protein
VQAAVTDLLMDIQRENKTTLLFISHDLSIVRYLSDRVMVMYLGHVVEMGTTDQVFQPPYHPYTEALLSAVPIADTKVIRKRIVLEGDIPSAMNPPPGCPFQTRCRWKSQVPGGPVRPRDAAGAACWRAAIRSNATSRPEVLATMEPVIKIARMRAILIKIAAECAIDPRRVGGFTHRAAPWPSGAERPSGASLAQDRLDVIPVSA